jgi:hypothetical protein
MTQIAAEGQRPWPVAEVLLFAFLNQQHWWISLDGQAARLTGRREPSDLPSPVPSLVENPERRKF